MASLSPGARVGVLVALVVGAVAASIGLGGGAVSLLVIIAVVLVVGRNRSVISAPFGNSAPLWPAVIQAWWAPLAALLAAMIVLGVGTVFEAHNLGGRVLRRRHTPPPRQHDAARTDATALRPCGGQLHDPGGDSARFCVLLDHRASGRRSPRLDRGPSRGIWRRAGGGGNRLTGCLREALLPALTR